MRSYKFYFCNASTYVYAYADETGDKDKSLRQIPKFIIKEVKKQTLRRGKPLLARNCFKKKAIADYGIEVEQSEKDKYEAILRDFKLSNHALANELRGVKRENLELRKLLKEQDDIELEIDLSRQTLNETQGDLRDTLVEIKPWRFIKKEAFTAFIYILCLVGFFILIR